MAGSVPMEILIVSLLGVGLLIFMALVLEVVLLAAGDLARSYADTLRRLRRNPRFGLLTLLEIVVVLAVTLSILRWIGLWDYPRRGSDWAAVAIVGFIALVLAVGIVCGVHVLTGDAWDLYRWKRASRRRRQRKTDPWDTVDDESSLTFAVDEDSDSDRPDEDQEA